MTVTPKEQFQALQAICLDACLKLDIHGCWYVYLPGIEIGGDGLLMSIGSHEDSPESAISSTWTKIVSLEPNKYLVKDASRETRKHYRWSGFMWTEVAT